MSSAVSGISEGVSLLQLEDSTTTSTEKGEILTVEKLVRIKDPFVLFAVFTSLEQNEELKEEKEKMEAARLLAICLDDSDDENMGIKLTESSRKL